MNNRQKYWNHNMPTDDNYFLNLKAVLNYQDPIEALKHRKINIKKNALYRLKHLLNNLHKYEIL